MARAYAKGYSWDVPPSSCRIPALFEIDMICEKRGKWISEWFELPFHVQELMLQRHRAEQRSYKFAPKDKK